MHTQYSTPIDVSAYSLLNGWLGSQILLIIGKPAHFHYTCVLKKS